MRSSYAARALLGLVLLAPSSWSPRTDHRAPAPLAGFEDYRHAAGTRHADTLVVALEVRDARWRPEGDKGFELPALTFVERGTPARVPGPMLRVPAGTVIKATLANTTALPVAVFGLQDHPAGPVPDSVLVAPNVEQVLTFRVTAPGTYYYWGRTRKPGSKPSPFDAIASGLADEGTLIGALIVDPAGETAPVGERVLMLTRWAGPTYDGAPEDRSWNITVNGASWPHTERLEYTTGDTVRWRVLNPMGVYHPMHLHGFYFDVTSRGDNKLDTLYTPQQRRTVVTELMSSFSTMSLAWVPDRPGNWLFHCHLIRHMDLRQRLGPDTMYRTQKHGAHTANGSAPNHAEDHMAGLVLGIVVHPTMAQAGAAALARAVGIDRPAGRERVLRLFATSKARVFGDAPGYSFIQQDGARAPAADSMRLPGSTLVLTRAEPTRITVVNHTTAPLAVHWHGMEIESWFDGVGGWSGMGRSVRPPIAPGDSFAVRMTPRRSGTFIYHSHDETGSQLGSGLYGALLVMEPGQARDTTRDHLIVLGLRGVNNTACLAVNGDSLPKPLSLSAGVAHRLRFVSIPASERVFIDLVRGDSTVQSWIPLAYDGAELSGDRQVARRARTVMSAGQTLDVQVRLDSAAIASGGYALRFRTTFYPSLARKAETVMMPIVASR
jgi:manganese oxidase